MANDDRDNGEMMLSILRDMQERLERSEKWQQRTTDRLDRIDHRLERQENHTLELLAVTRALDLARIGYRDDYRDRLSRIVRLEEHAGLRFT